MKHQPAKYDRSSERKLSQVSKVQIIYIIYLLLVNLTRIQYNAIWNGENCPTDFDSDRTSVS